MFAIQEITDWEFPNHTYIFDEQKRCVGYVRSSDNTPQRFGKPTNKFSRSHRKFKKLKEVPFREYFLS